MTFSSRVNRFIEDRLGIQSYPIKVVLLFTLIIFISMFLAFTIDVSHSIGEVKSNIEKASQRAAKFRTTAINNLILDMFKADVSLSRLIDMEGLNSIKPFVGSYVECAVGKGFSIGKVPQELLKRAKEHSQGRKKFFYLDPSSWKGVVVIRDRGKTFFFCHDASHMKNILSKKLGAIARYGAEFYLGQRPTAGKLDVLVVYKNAYSNADMFVLVPFKNIASALIGERVFLYLRLFFVFVLFLALSYLLWAKLVNYPVRRLKEVVEELEKGNYDVEFEDMLLAKDEFGSISRLLKEFAEETRSRLDKLELILETAFKSLDSPEDVENFVRSTLERINRIFDSKASLFIVEEEDSGKPLYMIYHGKGGQEESEFLLEVYRDSRKNLPESFEEPTCVRDKKEGGCVSVALFRIDTSIVGGVALHMENEIDKIDESYLKVICQHLFGIVRLTYMATTDPLTKVPNRRALEKDLRKLMAIHGRYGKPFSLIMIDIDNFKGVNDTYGHAVGDVVLSEVVSLIKESIRDTDTVYRYGGEEFAILCPETDRQGAYDLSERVREKIKETRIEIEEGSYVYITVSSGIASYPEDASDVEELLAVADISLYKAKREGKNRTALLSDSSDREYFITKFRREEELRESVLKGTVTHELQPIYDMSGDEVFGYELLFRVVRGEELVPMGAFIDAVEDLGLIEEIDRLTIKDVSDMLKREEFVNTRFFINVSPRSLEKGRILEDLTLIPKHKRSRVFIEITEREPFLNTESALERVEELKNMGYRVVIDDFGSGFSSIYQMRHLIKFIDLIKVDGSLVRNVFRDPYNRYILESLRVMAGKFSIELIAEFIETERDFETVKGIGIRLGQGFFFKGRES